MTTLYNLVRLIRPSHWIKNGFVLAALVFARRVGDPQAWVLALEAFAAFCLASSAIYALNDVLDRRADALHPKKRNRPVASGAIGVGPALATSLVLAIAAVAVAFVVREQFPLILGSYLVVALAYTLGLKRIAVLDVILLAVGFVIRAYAGAKAIDVEVSPWLMLCTLTLTLFLGFAKRESERVALGAGAAGTRPMEWGSYDEKSLEHMMTVSASLAVVTYMMYTVSSRTIEHVGGPWMFVTILPVLYAIFRFYRVAITGRATGPVEMILHDPAFVVALAVWGAMVGVLLFAF